MWAIRHNGERLLETTKLRMFRRIREIIDGIRIYLGVENITLEPRQTRLRRYEQILQMDEGSKVNQTMNMEVMDTRVEVYFF